MARAVDIGIVTILDEEFRAVLLAFPESAKPELYKRRRHYNLRLADAGTGAPYRIAILRQTERGNGEAQAVARDILEDLSPSLILVVGIAGGVPSRLTSHDCAAPPLPASIATPTFGCGRAAL